jgi:hypothetical protein
MHARTSWVLLRTTAAAPAKLSGCDAVRGRRAGLKAAAGSLKAPDEHGTSVFSKFPLQRESLCHDVVREAGATSLV